MKKLYLFIFFLLPSLVSGQDISYYKPTGLGSYVASSTVPQWYVNLEKYWYYRYRLVNDFTCVGPNPGESLIAERRIKGDVITYPGKGANNLDFADDETIDLGSYMSVLATEYEQLKQNGFSTGRTFKEIQYAQNAFDRLRLTSTNYYTDMKVYSNSSNPCTSPTLYPPTSMGLVQPFSTSYDATANGFFIRDDVPFLTFLDKTYEPTVTSSYPDPVPANMSINTYHALHFNRPGLYNSFGPYGTSTDPLKSVVSTKVGGCIRNGYSGVDLSNPSHTYATTPGYPNYESQDQFTQLYVGEMQLITYLDDPTSDVHALRLRAENALYHSTSFLDHTSGSPLKFVSIPDPIQPNVYAVGHNPYTNQVFLPSAFPSMFGLRGWYNKPGISSPWAGATNSVQNDAKNMLDYYVYGKAMQQDIKCCNYPLQNLNFPDEFSCYGHELAWWTNIPLGACALIGLALGIALGVVLFSSLMTIFAPLFAWILAVLSAVVSTLFYAVAGIAVVTAVCMTMEAIINWYTWKASSISDKKYHTWQALTRHSWDFNFCQPHLPLLYQLNTGHYWTYGHYGDIENLLNIAPPCGPWNYENSTAYAFSPTNDDWNNSSLASYPNREWNGNNRLTDYQHRQGVNCIDVLGHSCNRYTGTLPGEAGNDQGYDCDFNGLDYMWLFNLYSMTKGGMGASASYLHGMMNPYYMENYNVDYPDMSGIGSSSNKLKLNWLQYLSAVNKVHTNGWLDYRGAQTIDLKPGFHAQSGSFFYAHIKDYSCSGGDVAPGDESSFNFAEINPERPGGTGLMPAHADLTGKDGGWQPIAYYIPGYNARPLTPGDTVDATPNYDEVMKNLHGNMEDDKATILEFLNLIKQSPELQEFLKVNGDSLDYVSSILYPDTLFAQVSPDPTNGVAYLTYSTSVSNAVLIKLTNSLGQDMSYAIENYEHNVTAGTYKVALKLDNVAAGMYFVTIQVGKQTRSFKISVVK
jgi:hypothetical protein